MFHFATHGALPRSGPSVASIQLDDSAFEFTQLRGSDVAQGLAAATPFVFLNACHSGRQDMAIAGSDGWVQRFLDLGCSGFIGANWMVNDALAAEFAIALYKELIRGTRLSSAVRIARSKVREMDPGNGTWLAYTAYGHPLFVLSAGAPPH
jgi:CHAT domain-containing protein